MSGMSGDSMWQERFLCQTSVGTGPGQDCPLCWDTPSAGGTLSSPDFGNQTSPESCQVSLKAQGCLISRRMGWTWIFISSSSVPEENIQVSFRFLETPDLETNFYIIIPGKPWRNTGQDRHPAARVQGSIPSQSSVPGWVHVCRTEQLAAAHPNSGKDGRMGSLDD